MMKRELNTLANDEFDLLIIGGGIYGATLAWDAVLRGLKVAIVEKGDFASGTSSNSLKIIHGGLRYLQHADFARMRESIKERRILLRIAPHLVSPMPCVMPTTGHAVKGPEVMRIGLMMNDLFSADRNWGLDPAKRLPAGKILSKSKLLEMVPHLQADRLNGGALWYDAHMSNSERLLLSFLRSAAEQGVAAANYVRAEGLILNDGRVAGVKAKDLINDESFDIRAKLTITSAGPWVNNMLAKLRGDDEKRIEYSTAINLIVKRKFSPELSFAAPTAGEFKDDDAFISKGSRLLFFVPWRDHTIAGTAHKPYYGDAEDYSVTARDVDEFLQEVNSALPGADITPDEVSFAYAGLLPMSGVNQQSGDVQLQKHFKIIDHAEEDNIEGLLSAVTVKFTTARGVSEVVVDRAVQKLGFGRKKSLSRNKKIWGGEIEDYHSFMKIETQKMNGIASPESKTHLLNTYGSRYNEIVDIAKDDAALLSPLASDTSVLGAEIVHGVRHEMAQKLSDVTMRRTELGTVGRPSDEAIARAAELMAIEMNWSNEKKQTEIADYINIYEIK